MADSYYTLIRGKKYDRRMLELAEGLTKGRGDGRISVTDAKNLLRVVKDSNSYSPVEKATMEYIRKKYKFTKEGDVYFRDEIRKWAANKGKKKTAPKTKAPARSANASPAPVSAPAPVAEAPAYTPAVSEKKSSPWKEIFLGILLLAVIAAAFYFFAYKSGCAKTTPDSAPKPVTEVIPPSTPDVVKPVEPAKPAEVKPPVAAKPAEKPAAPVAAKPAARSDVPADLKNAIEKTQLIFIAERTDLTPTTVKKLDALAKRLKGENLRIQLTGHTCSWGPKALNQQISEKRANVAKEALIARGVPAASIETRGIADAETIGDQKTVAGRVASRRVTFKVLQ